MVSFVIDYCCSEVLTSSRWKGQRMIVFYIKHGTEIT